MATRTSGGVVRGGAFPGGQVPICVFRGALGISFHYLVSFASVRYQFDPVGGSPYFSWQLKLEQKQTEH
jgi:hypothetical protein